MWASPFKEELNQHEPNGGSTRFCDVCESFVHVGNAESYETDPVRISSEEKGKHRSHLLQSHYLRNESAPDDSELWAIERELGPYSFHEFWLEVI